MARPILLPRPPANPRWYLWYTVFRADGTIRDLPTSMRPADGRPSVCVPWQDPDGTMNLSVFVTAESYDEALTMAKAEHVAHVQAEAEVGPECC